MADVWRAEVHYTATAADLTPAATPGTVLQPLAQVGFGATQVTSGEYVVTMAMVVSLSGGAHFETQAVADFYATNVVDPLFTSPAVPVNIGVINLNDGGAAYKAGGKLIIEKDFDAGIVRVTTPIGIMTASLATIGDNNNTQIRPHALGLRLNLRTPQVQAERNPVRWSGFWGVRNGVRYMGAARSDQQPGTWTGWGNEALIGINPATFTQSQQPGYYATELSDDLGGAAPQEQTVYFDQWNGSFTTITDIPLVLDLARDRASGTVWYVRVIKKHPEQVRIGRSQDYGSAWTELPVGTLEQTASRAPSVTFRTDRKVWVVWHDGTNARVNLSENLGRSFPNIPGIYLSTIFGAGVTTPFQFFDPEDGIEYVTSNSGGALRLQRIDASGVASPAVTLASGLLGDAYPAAMFNSAREIILEFSDGTNRYLMRSDDLGSAFLTEFSGPSSAVAQRHIQHSSGLTFHLQAEPNAGQRDLYVGVSADSGVTFHFPRVLVGAGVPPQFADIEEMTDGSLLVAYQVYDAVNDEYDVVTKRSGDLGRTWV